MEYSGSIPSVERIRQACFSVADVSIILVLIHKCSILVSNFVFITGYSEDGV